MDSLYWQAGRFTVDLARPKIMGIVNLTPDSFSDGGTYSQTVQTALKHAGQLLKDGADILDVGGESTRPGSDYVSPEEEWARVSPVLQELVAWNVPVSLDTRRTEVMRRALEQGGVDIINDVSALSDDGAVNLLARQTDTGICLMHMQGMPATMQENPQYQDVVKEVADYLNGRAAVCEAAGIARERIVLDPGFGFGKKLPHNIALMRHLEELMRQTALPLLVGVSRKRMIGELTGEENAAGRIHGSVAAALAAVARGVQIVRVHDVKATADALKVWSALGV
ncbi:MULTISPECIES: dihydropteroate synthase [unclassified Neisseria]|uniref:dihydropteroate synthase n=1 Tax=unclassified Neisseria TaxID=2623750 RepID=UPI002666EF3D|nr:MULTISPECIES: dihydropteroate synthase [unclassified Neisseria]MDO1508795.1 dihydropteroate synthase [Neisseria sp. MVDL19-042950]MDO1515054.1 dihydropteroate synthase [Neisseria sp. MVDL18-041461]MDO1562414.1 dihydropteroate synthase [Neisseria sp. MVDL20-010259]